MTDREPTDQRRPPALATALALGLLSTWTIAGALVMRGQNNDTTIAAREASSVTATAPAGTAPGAVVVEAGSGSAAMGVKLPKPCTPITTRFTPVKIAMPGVTSGAPVIPVGRVNGTIGSPPISTAGKREFGWDRPPGILPGSPRGTAVFTAHTWPDGSALGNRMLRSTHEGDEIRLFDAAGNAYCYTVKTREQLPANKQVPGVYAKRSLARLVFIACSGRRLGPGHWTGREVWWVRPTKL